MQTLSIIKKTIPILLLLSIALVPVFSHAQSQNQNTQNTLQTIDEATGSYCNIITNPWPCLTGLIEMLGRMLTYIPATIATAFIGIGAALANYMIGISGNILDLDTNPLLQTGFEVTLGLANLGFVLAIIVIAFATMLRIESYAMKQTLWKLVVAALLVNFSLPIAGLIIDFTNVLAYFFVNAGGGTGVFENFGTFTDNIVAAFSPQKLWDVKDSIGDSGTELIFNLIITPIFITIFSAITAITMLIFGFMLLMRYIYLEILLILMPLVWLMWIFPNLSHMWSKWWNQFLKWNFFLPAATFFIYLVLIVVQIQGNTILTQSPDSRLVSFVGDSLLIENAIPLFLQMIILSGLMLGGLMAANSIGIAGASTGMKWAQGLKKWTIGQAGKYGVRVASKPLRSWAGRKFTAALQRTPLLGGIGNALSDARIASEKKILDPYRKSLQGKSAEELALRYKAAAYSPERAVIEEMLSKHYEPAEYKIGADGKPEKDAAGKPIVIKEEKTGWSYLPANAKDHWKKMRREYGQNETKISSKKRGGRKGLEAIKEILEEEGVVEEKKEIEEKKATT